MQGILRDELGYGEEISVSSEVGLVYDPGFDDNLGKKLGELGIGMGGFVTVVDDAEEEPRVNLVLAISEGNFSAEQTPMRLASKFEIARKIKVQASAGVEENGNGGVKNGDGIGAVEVVEISNGAANGAAFMTNGKRKRQAGEELEGDIARKRGKVVAEPVLDGMNGHGGESKVQNGDGAVVVDDHIEKAIMIDD